MNFLVTHSPRLVDRSQKFLPISDISAYPIGGKIHDLRDTSVPNAVDGLKMAVKHAEPVGRMTNPELISILDSHLQKRQL